MRIRSSNGGSQYPVKFSLVVATLARVRELDLLLESLRMQSFRSFEVIIVDQNRDERLASLIEHWSSQICILHLRAEPGLSRARNIGISVATGEIVAFPDDDCWYPQNLLERIGHWFTTYTNAGLLCCIARDEAGREAGTRWPARSQYIDRRLVLRTCSSSCLFVRRALAEEVSGFDECMGLGAGTPFGSAEDLDFALRVLNTGSQGVFDRRFHIFHPPCGAEDRPSARAFSYGTGFGHLLRKHHYSDFTLVHHILRALGGMLVATLRGRWHSASFHWNSFRGRIWGYVSNARYRPRRQLSLGVHPAPPSRREPNGSETPAIRS